MCVAEIKHAIDPYSGLLLRKGFGTVDQLTGHHARVDHNDRQPGCSIIENEALGPDRILDLARLALEKTPVDQDREARRCNINRISTGTKRGSREQTFPCMVAGAGRSDDCALTREDHTQQENDARTADDRSHGSLDQVCALIRFAFGAIGDRGTRRESLTE